MGALRWSALIAAFLVTVVPHMIVAFFRAPFVLWSVLHDAAKEDMHKESMQRVFVLKPASGEPLEFKDWKN